MDPRKWDAYLSIARKVESGGAGDDVTRDPRDLAMQDEFIDIFARFLPPPARVLAPGGVSEAVKLAQRGYEVHALVLGVDNARWIDSHKLPNLHCRERDAHDLDYPANFFDGYFTVQFHEHLVAPYIHVGEVRRCMRDGGIVFVDAAGTTNPAMKMVWHQNLQTAELLLGQWEFHGYKEVWRGPQGDDRPQFVFEKLPDGHPDFKNWGYLQHVYEALSKL